MTDKRIEKIYKKLKAEVISERDANLQLIKAEQLISFCWKNYPLQFSDVDIESALEKNMISSNQLLDKKKSRIVYVASTLFAVGGHSRCILNFIDNQPNHQHTVILTRQNKSIPTNLTAFFEAKNVDVIIHDVSDLPLSKSTKLLLQVDFINPQKVYLFQHPDDLVPLIAFGKNTSHEVVQYSHADHVYSLGVKYFNKQLEFRNTGALISHFGKNVKTPQIQVLPIQNHYETPNRIEAKKKLGFDSNQRIIGMLTNFSKAQSFNGFPSLVDVFLKLSEKYPNCVFVIIGLNENEFKSIAGRTIQIPHNICCLGIVVNPEPYYETFDFFLEPFPIGSGLGVIEACKHGAIPVFAPQQARLCSTFDVFHVEIQKHLIEATTIEAFYSSINNYLNAQPDEINVLSEKIKTGIYQYHRGEKWVENLEKNAFPFEFSHLIEPELFLKNEALFFQNYQKKSNAELIEHLLSLKQLVTKKLLLSFFIGRNQLFSIFDLNRQNAKRIAIKFLKS
jgi:hypothetical protein